MSQTKHQAAKAAVDKRLAIIALGGVAAYLLLVGESRDTETNESDNAPSIFDEVTNTAEDWIMGSQSNITNRLAFLLMLRVSEGTAGSRGYNTQVGYTYFEDYSTHPALAGWRGMPLSAAMCAGAGLSAGCVSTAAGAYQITRPTYKRVAANLGISDFTPESQDAIAIELIREKGALGDVDSGNFAGAVNKVRKVWASLPGAGYGQHENTLARLENAYVEAGGVLA